MEKLIKVELGCGKTKTDGYIGVDRFPMPDVDIVTDINKGLPFDHDSVDVIYACHALEHMKNLQNVMEEIYRISKNKAIVQILSPYSLTSLNEANYYHKNIFNEDTFRLFTSYPTKLIDPEEYYCPHSPVWGLGNSDNSELIIQFEPIKIEFFYYKEYRHLSKEQKRHARRSLHNVCDQLFYVLVVNKSNAPFSDIELKDLREYAKTIEPPIISQLRIRDLQYNNEKSILTDIKQPLIENQRVLDKSVSIIQKDICDLQKNICELQKDEKDLQNDVTNLQKENSNLKQIIETQSIRYIELEQSYNQRLDDVTRMQLEILKNIDDRNWQYSKRYILHKKRDLFPFIQKKSQKFIDQMILNCVNFNKDSNLKLSKVVPHEDYLEYFIQGYGEEINYYLVSNYGACLFVEVVLDGKIVKQERINNLYEGPYQIKVEKVKGNAAIRFRTLNNTSIVRVLEFANHRFGVFEKTYLAGFIL